MPDQAQHDHFGVEPVGEHGREIGVECGLAGVARDEDHHRVGLAINRAGMDDLVRPKLAPAPLKDGADQRRRCGSAARGQQRSRGRTQQQERECKEEEDLHPPKTLV